MLHALAYAYRHRRERKGDMRELWIVRIGAAAREHGVSYSRLMHGLKLAGIALDRKALADLAMHDAPTFGSWRTRRRPSSTRSRHRQLSPSNRVAA